MTEYYRQSSFVSSIPSGFALTFYATLLTVSRDNRPDSWASLLTVAASTCFLAVTIARIVAALGVLGVGFALAPFVEVPE